ncbi:hypothetical protein HAX54_020423 [Datura stramonium]|uniref:Protein kinase domain-containing protein n=1 Tax=Datura stramonium TaxID=4076 RepID=A0ABS8UT25_DATST|nr:hypothetical protein [Datura stramonium]
MNQRMPLIYVKLYTYQIWWWVLAYIHNCIGICHRDIKPQNLLVNPHTHQLKLCDFGSAKVLVKGEPNVYFLVSHCFWVRGVDQLVEIIKVLGTPTREEIKCMNPNYTEFKFPQIKPHPWHKNILKDGHMLVLLPNMILENHNLSNTLKDLNILPIGSHVSDGKALFSRNDYPEAAFDLICRFFQYSPYLRCTALEANIHPFFDELRILILALPMVTLPPLYNFKPQELTGIPTETLQRLVPEHARRQNLFMAYHPSDYFVFCHCP